SCSNRIRSHQTFNSVCSCSFSVPRSGCDSTSIISKFFEIIDGEDNFEDIGVDVRVDAVVDIIDDELVSVVNEIVANDFRDGCKDNSAIGDDDADGNNDIDLVALRLRLIVSK
ncbi:hypothetical protein SSS_10181, partial [Sarcoptes scabiei]